MAFIPCKIGGGGSGFVETPLWTNSAPSSSFGGQTVTLSDSINNYDYIKVKFKVTTTQNAELEMLISSSALVNSLASSNHGVMTIAAIPASGIYVRYITYTSDTQLAITSAYTLNTAGSNNANTIPTAIVGCKFA